MKRIILLLIVLAFVLTACGPKIANNQPNTIVKSDTETQKQIEVTLYFPNKEYIQTGNEALPKVLPEKRIIIPGNNLELAVLNELFKGPVDTQRLGSLPQRLKLIGVRVEGDTAFVNFSSQGLSGGSLEEGMVINSIVTTLTGLTGIHKVQFLVDGKVTETLMGHIDISKPLTAPAR